MGGLAGVQTEKTSDDSHPVSWALKKREIEVKAACKAFPAWASPVWYARCDGVSEVRVRVQKGEG